MIDLTPSKYKKMLNEKINILEKELQTLKDNLYEVFFSEDLTNKK